MSANVWSFLVRGAWIAAGLMLMLSVLSTVALAGAGPPTPHPIPEIDPGAALSALTFLTGCVLVVSDRWRSR
jgi:hypothetical protein